MRTLHINYIVLLELDAIFRKQPWIEPEVVASNELHDSGFEQLNERDSAIKNMPSSDYHE